MLRQILSRDAPLTGILSQNRIKQVSCQRERDELYSPFLPEDQVFQGNDNNKDPDTGEFDGQCIIFHHGPDTVPSGPLDKPEEGIGHVGRDARPGTEKEDKWERVDCIGNCRTCKDFGRDDRERYHERDEGIHG